MLVGCRVWITKQIEKAQRHGRFFGRREMHKHSCSTWEITSTKTKLSAGCPLSSSFFVFLIFAFHLLLFECCCFAFVTNQMAKQMASLDWRPWRTHWPIRLAASQLSNCCYQFAQSVCNGKDALLGASNDVLLKRLQLKLSQIKYLFTCSYVLLMPTDCFSICMLLFSFLRV